MNATTTARNLTPAETSVLDACSFALATDFDTPAKVTERRAATSLGWTVEKVRKVSWELGTLRGE